MSAGVITTAAVFHGVEAGLTVETVEVGPPAPGEVRLRVAACGACHSDVHKLQGHGLVPPPVVFGHEISGVVTAVGDGVDTLAAGDRVVCTFLVPCGDCPACRRGAQDECGPFRTRMQREGVRFAGTHRLARIDGTPLRTSGVGGLAGEITMPATAVFRLPVAWPDRISLADAAVLGCAGLTAYGAVHEAARIRPGERVVVLGGGGVGLCTVALARHAGATVVATDTKAAARDALTRFGAVAALPADTSDLVEQVRGALGGEPAVVVDTVGVGATVAQALALAAVGGRVVVSGLGGTSGARIDDLTVFVRRKLSLIGSYAAVPARDMPRLLDAVVDGALDPADLISTRYPFADVVAAYADVAAGRITGRALVLGPDPLPQEEPCPM
jgi:Zn-dependent alcohol dehydrogenase